MLASWPISDDILASPTSFQNENVLCIFLSIPFQIQIDICGFTATPFPNKKDCCGSNFFSIMKRGYCGFPSIPVLKEATVVSHQFFPNERGYYGFLLVFFQMKGAIMASFNFFSQWKGLLWISINFFSWWKGLSTKLSRLLLFMYTQWRTGP